MELREESKDMEEQKIQASHKTKARRLDRQTSDQDVKKGKLFLLGQKSKATVNDHFLGFGPIAEEGK